MKMVSNIFQLNTSFKSQDSHGCENGWAEIVTKKTFDGRVVCLKWCDCEINVVMVVGKQILI